MSKILTKGQLLKIENRIDEIDSLLSSDLEEDVHNNLIDELDCLLVRLEKSLKIARIKESGLRLVK